MKKRFMKWGAVLLAVTLFVLSLSACQRPSPATEADTTEPETTAPAGPQPGEATAEDRRMLDDLYAGRTLYQGEMHNHAKTYGRGPGALLGDDGNTPLSDWKGQMKEYGLDFAACLDHNQYDHFEHPDWDTRLFVYGSEASVRIIDSNDQNYAQKHGQMHFDMIFRTEEDFVGLINEHKNWFRYDEETHIFSYNGLAAMKRAEFTALIEAVYAAGGMVSLPHPMQNHGDDEIKLTDRYDLVFLPKDADGNQIIYGFMTITSKADSASSRKNHETWVQLLNVGAKIYAAAGSDNHKDLNDLALTSIYGTAEAEEDKGALIEKLRCGDFAAGSVGIQMCAYGDGNKTAMGGICDFSDNPRLVARIGNIHYRTGTEDASSTYRVDLLNDKGVVFSQEFTGEERPVIAIDTEEKSAFYRVEVYDVTRASEDWPQGVLIGIGNPIWNK